MDKEKQSAEMIEEAENIEISATAEPSAPASKKKKASKLIYWILIGLFASVFLCSAIFVVDYMVDSYKHKQIMEYIQSLHNNPSTGDYVTTKPTPPAEPTGSSGSTAPTDPAGSSGATTPTDPTADPTRPTDPSVGPTDPAVDPTHPTDPEVRPTEPNPPEPTEPKPTEPQPTEPKPTDPPEPPFPTRPSIVKPEILPEMQQLYAINDDVVGWITISGTAVDYPVMQRKDIKGYYLYRNFYEQEDRHGSIYVEEHNDVFRPSDVVTLHGHHMLDETMFYTITRFKYKEFFNNHPYVQFDTLYEHRTYQVVLIFRINADTSDTEHFFPFHTYNNFKNEAQFNEFMNNIERLAVQKSKVEVNYGDKLLLMSTCDYSPYINGRLVLVAKLIETD